MSLRTAKRLIQRLGLRDLFSLDDWLHERIEDEREPKVKEHESKRDVVPGSARAVGDWTMQLEYVTCGKECKTCGRGRGHGPYWYGYRKSGGRTVSKYFGKNLPGRNAQQQAGSRGGRGK